MLDYNNYHISSLANDIPILELRFGEANESETTSKKGKSKELDTPTLVTLVNFRKGKRDRSVYLQNCCMLINTGASHSLCTKQCVKENKHKWKKKKKSFNMGAGEMKTAYKTKVAFSLSEFSESKIIEWRFNVWELVRSYSTGVEGLLPVYWQQVVVGRRGGRRLMLRIVCVVLMGWQ